MFILNEAEKQQRLKHPVQELKGLMALLTPSLHHNTVGMRNDNRGSASASGRSLREASTAELLTPSCSRLLLLWRESSYPNPLGLSLKEALINLGEYTHSPFSNSRKSIKFWLGSFLWGFLLPSEGHLSFYHPLLGMFLLSVLHTMRFLASCQVVGFLENLPIFYTSKRSSEITEEVVQL